MRFRVKDLMISVGSKDDTANIYDTCPAASCTDSCRRTCGDSCLACTETCFASCRQTCSIDFLQGEFPARLAALKIKLQADLAMVEAHEKAVDASTTLKSKKDAELLESRLNEALKEIARVKKTLK